MDEVSPDPAKSASWPKPADLSGMVIGRNLMCHKTEVSVGNLVSPAGFKNCEYLLQIGRKFYLCMYCVPCLTPSLLLCTGIRVPPCETGTLMWKRDKSKSSLFLVGRLSRVVCFKVIKKTKKKKKKEMTSALAATRRVIYTGWQTLHEV